MPMKQLAIAIIENIERGTRSRIDLEQAELVVSDKKIGTVEPDHSDRLDNPRHDCTELPFAAFGKAGRPRQPPNRKGLAGEGSGHCSVAASTSARLPSARKDSDKGRPSI